MSQTLSKNRYKGTLQERLMLLLRNIKTAIGIATQFFLFTVLGQLMTKKLARMKENGETIWIDDLYFGKRDTVNPEHRADISSDMSVKSRKSRVMKIEQYPAPDYPFAFREAPLSGNIINGLGETEIRRPRKVFHTTDYSSMWGGLERYFHSVMVTPDIFRGFQRTQWDNRNRTGIVAANRQEVSNLKEMSEIMKATAYESGADLVGITELRDEFIFEHATMPHKYAISLAIKMDREAMLHTPSMKANFAIQDSYEEIGKVAIDLAERIRAIGWEATAATNLGKDTSEVLHVPIAVDAGLGQLGKHGSLITLDYGSNVRLATVLTNLPMEIDTFADIGVDDFCASCQICMTNCPPHAIFNTKQIVRGEERWSVNFDRCIPYFSENYSCAICIEVCPWSEAGRGITIMDKMMVKRAAQSSPETQI